MRLPWPFRKREQRTVTVDPVQIAALHFLLRFGAATQDTLYQEIRGIHGINEEMFTTAMADLVAQDIADYRYNPENGETALVLTSLGLRLRRRLPEHSRSRLAIYL